MLFGITFCGFLPLFEENMYICKKIEQMQKEEAINRVKLILRHKKEMEERAREYLSVDYQKEFGNA